MAQLPSTQDLVASPPGILLPPGVVQPFDLRFSADDIHVIAYLQGHPVYEAVEAMIVVRDGQPTRARAILTRHDMTQVDHVSDDIDFAAAKGCDERPTVHRQVGVRLADMDRRPSVTVSFRSFANEEVRLNLIALGPADARCGGLADPGGHASGSSLPIMWRERSVMAGQGTSVCIDGLPFEVRERFRLPTGATSLDGYLTEGHRMGAFRAGQRSIEIMREPARIETGGIWQHLMEDGRTVRWVATQASSTGEVAVESDSGVRRERVLARAEGAALRILRVDCFQEEPGLHLCFLPNRRWSAGFHRHPSLVTGTFSVGTDAGGGWHIRLAPAEPEWAVERRVNVGIMRSGRQAQIRTRLSWADEPR